MSGIVYAGATSHVGAILRKPDALPERTAELDAAWQRMSDDLHAAAPDAVVVIATDHYETFGLANYPTFAMGIADEYQGWGEFGNPDDRVVGDGELATRVLTSLVGSGFDLAHSQEMALDHSFMVPILRLGLTDLPVVPLFVNCNTPPLPTLGRCQELGVALGRSAQETGTRLAVLGTGGVSHWVGLPQFGQINDEWDRLFLDLLARGDTDEIAGWSDRWIHDTAGNGALEIRTWLAAHSAAGGSKGELLAYHPMPPWAIGIGIMRMELG